jgi:hypothetical protein
MSQMARNRPRIRRSPAAARPWCDPRLFTRCHPKHLPDLDEADHSGDGKFQRLPAGKDRTRPRRYQKLRPPREHPRAIRDGPLAKGTISGLTETITRLHEQEGPTEGSGFRPRQAKVRIGETLMWIAGSYVVSED